MRGIIELILGALVAFFVIWIGLHYVWPYVSGHTSPTGGVKGEISTTEEGGSSNWKFDIIDKLIKSTSSPKQASSGPYVFISSLEMLGHSFGAQVYQYFNISNTICCECESEEVNNWKVCVVDSCDQTSKQIQVVGPPGVDTLTENDLYMVSVEAGDDWVCLKFEVTE